MMSISRLKVGILYFKQSAGEGLEGVPESSEISGSEWIKIGFVPTGQVEELRKRASLDVNPPSLNWWGRNLKQIGIFVE